MARQIEKNTIWEIARTAGVSIATVSRAMRAETRGKVAPETLKHIEAIVKKRHYTPSLSARNLRATRFKTIGFMIPHIHNIFLSDYYSKLFCGFSNSLMGSDYRFKLVALKPYARKWDGYPFRSAEAIDAMVVEYWPTFFTPKFKVDVPCVIINDPADGIRAHFVTSDNEAGGELAARCLYEQGHECIAVLRGQEWSTDSDLRIKGFKRTMARVGTAVPNEMIFKGEYEEEDAARITERIFLEKKKVTAFFCCNDNMAFGVMRKLKQLGLRCPEDVSVVGFDDEGRASHSDPPLTTVRAMTQELGKVASEKIIALLEGKISDKEFFYKKTVLPVSLIERKSVGPVR